ncbi:MAG: Alpha/beta hydrolase family protein [Acidobacteria bacterium OLB17]|nr:MAG: Alpha/beta hydrolase family protein [Acidobacteria bacterium OLB17]
MAAQRRKAAAVPAAPKCSGAWTGTISYSRTQASSDSKTVERVSGRGRDTRNWEMSYTYNARVAVVESPERNGSSVGIANISHSFFSKEKIDAVEKNSCDRGKTWRDMRGSSTSETKTSGQASGEDANVSVGINADGTYTVSVGLPEIKGEVTGSQSSSFSGQCTPKEGKTFNLPAQATRIEGNSLTSDGSNRINPDDPNKLSGSYSRTWQNVTETISWNLQKCGAPLRITDMKFADMKFPKWNDWQDIAEQRGTIDGNLVKIKATILNASGETKFADVKFKETYKGDKWDGARPDGLLEGGEVSTRLEPGESRDVEFIWDSSGYAWFDDGRPRLLQRIKAELEENGKKVDEKTMNLKVAPKPLVLVHGLWSSWKAWESWQNILTTTHSYDWKAFPVGEKPEKGRMDTGGEFLSSAPTKSVYGNAVELDRYVKYAQEDRNAWHVDIVAHSMGGLISRQYIQSFMKPVEDGRPRVAHLIMLGTPNMGSPCADTMDIAFSITGTTPNAIRELKPDVVAEFNRVVTDRRGVKFSILAGDPLPVMCKRVVWNDGVVSVPSAHWIIKDKALSKNVHTDLTGTQDFSTFVRPRLAIGPKGDHLPEVEAPSASLLPEPGRYNGAGSGPFFGPAPMYVEDIGRAAKLAGKQTQEIEIPVAAAADLGITFMADAKISVELIDPQGRVAGKNLADSPGSRNWFRSIYLKEGVAAGTWKLRVTNTADLEHPAYFSIWQGAR